MCTIYEDIIVHNLTKGQSFVLKYQNIQQWSWWYLQKFDILAKPPNYFDFYYFLVLQRKKLQLL